MNPTGTANLSRSKSGGAEKRAPPPIRPKPSGLSAAAATTPTGGASAGSSVSSTSYRSGVTVTDNGAPTSNSFGDLKRAFERQQNAGPLFTGNNAIGSRIGGGTSTGSIHNNFSNNSAGTRTSLQASPSALLGVPSLNNSNRPRSLSSPAPPLREDEARKVEEPASGEGIDKSQPDFGNLRARFQSQASVSNVSLPKPDTPRPKPTFGANGPKPTFSSIASSPAPSPSIPRMSLDATRTAGGIGSINRFPTPQPPALAASGSASPAMSRASSSSFRQPPKPPVTKPNIAARTPTPPKTPPRAASPDEDEEKNPFMGSDEDEASASKAPSRTAAPPMPSRSTSKIHQNPAFQQLNSSFGRPGAAVSVGAATGALIAAKIAPPPPQRAAPRPISPPPSGAPPRLPSRSNSASIMAEDTPEEKERKHRLDKRRRVIQELLETEISYSKDMLLLQEVYVTDMEASGLFTSADEKIIFMNLADVITLTLDLIALLTPACGGVEDEGTYDDAGTFVGEVFLQMISRIRRIFSEYCKRQEASAQHLQDLDNRKDLKAFFDACTEKCKGKTTGWDLASLLIKPVQRVLKYPLLINQIHALTPPDHTDYENLVTVQKDMLQVAEEINEIKKRKDIVEKIVGSKKKNDSDIVHGFNKKFARTTQQLRQAVGGSDVTVDILFEALLEKFNLQQRLVREFAKYIQTWLISVKQYFDTQEAFALTLMEIYGMVPLHRNDENQSFILVQEYHKSIAQFSKTIGRELESRLKKTVYKSIERYLKLFSGPLQVMKKREKKLLDYDSVRGMKERGDTVDKNMLESANAYTAINEQLVDELPKFLGLTTQYFDIIVMEFSKVQMFYYAQVKAKVHSFYVEHLDGAAASASTDKEQALVEYLANMNITEEYIEAMKRPDGPIDRMSRISLIRNVVADHEVSFASMRETAQRRQRSKSFSLGRARSSSNASSITAPRHSKSNSLGGFRSKPLLDGDDDEDSSRRSSPLLQSPIQPRFYPGEDENPFEMPESIFHDNGSVSSFSDEFGIHGSGGRNVFGTSSDRPLSSASYASSGYGGRQHYNEEETQTKPPALDDGMDMDEIGIAQALFECTAIYPYQSVEDRQLSFEAGESIIVFGLNDDGWYFGKKVGKDTTGWFPASHCIQI
ncbi:hypothetical protein EMPS_02903 [Entomortierella parvispora]|uniref:Dynamin-binding protein n=1 Tax=Entomortierella parvispora TaxID=205924 RepID=A0A9P3LU50_9FUNG|nr:hypothetical protein EMPS_02903 [Entomortierella parvispora]